MASVSTTDVTLKCGYLTTFKEKSSLFGRQQKQKAYWKLKSQPTGLERYSNENDANPNKKINLVNTEVYKHNSDTNILCIRQSSGSQVRFLRADSREQRDEWCEAILLVIRTLSGQDPVPTCRPRVNTDATANRPLPRVGKRTATEVQSSAATLQETFTKDLVRTLQRPLPAPPRPETEDDGISKIQQTPYCCMRNHLVEFNAEGTNMADTGVIYENVHYVRSMEEWVIEVESRQKTLATQSDMYDDFHALDALLNNNQVQRPTSSSSALDQDCSEPVYEGRLLPQREPEENDERLSRPCIAVEDEDPYLIPNVEPFPFNNLNKEQPQQTANRSSLSLNLRPNSINSIEDNTEKRELSPCQKPCPEPPQRPKHRPEPPQRQKPRPEPPQRQKPRPEPPQRQKPRPEPPQRQKPRPEPPQRQKPHPEPPHRQKPRPEPTQRQKPQPLQEPMSERELQEHLRILCEEQRKRHGITKTLRKSSLVGNKIRLMEMKDGIWVMGWDPSETSLGEVFKVGDQLIKINKQALTSAKFAHDIINSTDDDEVTVVLKRVPHASVCTIKRRSPRDLLGFSLTGNEIVELDECGMVSTFGGLKPQTTGVSGHMCNWAITEVNMTPLDLFASEDSIFRMLRSGTLNELVLVVQPIDFVQMIREKLQEKL